MPTLPAAQLTSHHEAIDLAKQAIGITLYELAPPDEGYSIGLNLPDRDHPVFIAPQRASTAPRQWAKADTALNYVKHSLSFRGRITVELTGKPPRS